MNRKAIWVVLLALLLLGAGLGFFWPFRSATTLRLAGMVEIQEVRLGSKTSGRVAEVLVEEGKVIEAGTRMVVFEAPELEAMRDQLRAKLLQAQADFYRIANGARPEEKVAARAAALAAKARWAKLKFGWRDEEKKQAASELETARADFKQTVTEFERVSALFRQKSASQADLDVARGARDRAQGRLHAAEAKNLMMTAGSRSEDIAEAKAEFERVNAQAEMLDAGSRWEDIALYQAKVLEAKANLEEVDAKLREAVIVAPEKVRVDVVAVRKGDIIAPNQPVVRVLRADDVWVKVFVPEPQVGKISLGQEVDVFTDAYPDRPLKGRVSFIDAISEFTPRNIQSIDERRHQVFGVKVLVANAQDILKAGMAAEVKLPLAQWP